MIGATRTHSPPRTMHDRLPQRALNENARPTLDLRFRATIAAVPVARHSITRWLDEINIEPQVREDLALVVTELVTNAIEASPGPQHEVTLHAECERGQIVMKVSDEGSGFDLEQVTAAPEVATFRGRGLAIVNGLVDHLAVHRTDHRTSVQATIALAPQST